MNINELEREKTRLTKQLSDVLREKDEIQSALTQVEAEIAALTPLTPEQQIRDKRKEIDYDTKEFTIESLVNKYVECELKLSGYENWDSETQSKYIESLLLGIPVPPLLLTTKSDKLEVFDGSKRVMALSAFLNNYLQLTGLESVDTLNGFYYESLSPSLQRKFLNTSIRTIIFSNTSEDVKQDLAKRFN